MSDSDSSLSDVPRKVIKKRLLSSSNLDDDSSSSDDEAFKFTKRRFSPRNKGATENNNDKDDDNDDSDSDVSMMNSQLKRTKQKFASLSNDSDSDNDDVKNSSTSTSRLPGEGLANRTRAPISFESDDSDDDNVEIEVVESEVMRNARLAREALENETAIDLRDDDDDFMHPDDIPAIQLATFTTTMEARKISAPEPPATGPIIRIQFRANIASSPINHGGKALHGKTVVLNFRTGAKLETVMRRYRESVDQTITAHATVKFGFDGLIMDNDKTLAQYEMEDEDMIDVTISIPANAPPSSQAQPIKPPPVSSSDQYIQIETTIKGGDGSVHTFQLKGCDPLDKLVNAYRNLHGYSSLKRVLLEMSNIQLDTTLSPMVLGFVDTCHITICDEQERIKQIRRMPQTSNGSSTSNNIAGSVGGIKLKIRVNGAAGSFDTFYILPAEKFQKLMDWVCTKNNVNSPDCKYIFDGAPLNPNYTPNDEDLEGDEVIDVQIDKAALERGSKTAAPPPAMASSQVQTQDSKPSATQKLSIGSSRSVSVEGTLGVTVSMIDGFVRVRSIDSDKMKGILFPGDKITHANGKEIVGTTATAFAALLKSIGLKRNLTVQFLGRQDIDRVLRTASKPSAPLLQAAASVSTQQTGPCKTKTVPIYVIRNNVSLSALQF